METMLLIALVAAVTGIITSMGVLYNLVAKNNRPVRRGSW